MWVSSMPSIRKKTSVPAAIPARTVAIESTARPVSTVSPIRYSAKAAGATAFGHSTLTPFTRQDARKEIQPKRRQHQRHQVDSPVRHEQEPGTSSRHTTDSTVTVKFAICRDDVAPIANTATCARKTLCARRVSARVRTGANPASVTNVTPQVDHGRKLKR